MSQSNSRNLTGFALLLLLLGAAVAATMGMPGEVLEMPPETIPTGAGISAAIPDLSHAPPAVADSERNAIPTSQLLQVRVTDRANQPLAGVEVRYYPETLIGFPDELQGHTAADGRFQSEFLPAGIYRVRVASPGKAASSTQELHLPAPEGQELHFVLDQ